MLSLTLRRRLHGQSQMLLPVVLMNKSSKKRNFFPSASENYILQFMVYQYDIALLFFFFVLDFIGTLLAKVALSPYVTFSYALIQG